MCMSGSWYECWIKGMSKFLCSSEKNALHTFLELEHKTQKSMIEISTTSSHMNLYVALFFL